MKDILLLSLLFYLLEFIKSEEEYTRLTCPSGLDPRTQYMCAVDSYFVPENTCPIGGACQTSYVCKKDTDPKCPSLVKCPSEYPVRCPDNTCVQSPSDCPNYVECPPFLPVRCPNGDCRKQLADCPSTIYCSDWGYLCNDGSCRQSPNQCEKSTTETTCIDKSLVRCSDGTCQTSILLCASAKTCPVDRVLSYSGVCKKENENAGVNKEKCTSSQILCQFDYSCASSIDACPTGIICPSDRPVKCWDMSCASSIEACPNYQECQAGMTACPDGSCSTGTCGTHITCSKDAPYKCFDNTCRVNPEDCPEMPICSADAPILCWDGRCLADRSECTPPSTCDTSSPVKCPNGICAISVNECNVQYGCPSGFNMCKDGTCRQKMSDCVEQSCSLDLPYKCTNGMCVSDEKYCDASNGCPFNKPNKCKNGVCVKDSALCNEIGDPGTIDEDKKLCADGSIISKKSSCPLANGCASETPLLCGNGECINPKSTSCSVPVCPIEAPYRCLDGKCVYTSAYCPAVNSEKDENGLLTCADGKQAKSFEECRLLLPCSDYRCDDGSCKSREELCPVAPANYTCPDGKPYRCSDGTCAESEDDCTNSQGCPLTQKSRCPRNGLCASKTSDCTNYESKFAKSNGCATKTSYKCLSGKCAKSEADCGEGNGCNDPIQKVKCPNGKCRATKKECRNEQGDCDYPCPYDQFMECADEFGHCLNDLNCTIEKPFRCSDGQCKKYPKQLEYESSAYNDNACEIGIRCPDYKPFLCADGQCVSKKSFCISQPKCQEGAKETCFDRTCTNDKNSCSDKCPAKSPILCPNNNCVSSIYDCTVNACPTNQPIRCYSGKCLTAAYECLKNRNDTYYKSLCNDDEVTCYDGSCRTSFDQCPLFTGCVSMSAPYKCPSGECVKDSKSCSVTLMDKKYEECINKNYTGNATREECYHYRYNCTGDYHICEDGICRKECPKYNGCPYSKPMLCSNGECVKDEDECAAESSCSSIDKPFKCIDGQCVADMSECAAPLFRLGTSNIKLSSFKNSDITSDIVIGESNIPIGTIHIPTNALQKITNDDDKSYEGQISFDNVAQSDLEGTFAKFDATRKEDITRAFPFADPNNTYTIDHQYALLSSVIQISFDNDNVTLRQSLLLTLMFDFPLNVKQVEMSDETAQLFKDLDPFDDVCLARLIGKQWECLSGTPIIEKTDKYRLKGAVTEEGIYAVILNPSSNLNQLTIKKYWFITYWKAILIITCIILVIAIGLGYYFIRQMRFIDKYRRQAALYEKNQKELNDMRDLSTSVVGQSIADVQKGVVFTDNPAFRKKADADINAKRMKYETEYYKVSNNVTKLEKVNQILKDNIDSVKKLYENCVNDKNESMKVDDNSRSMESGNDFIGGKGDGKEKLLD